MGSRVAPSVLRDPVSLIVGALAVHRVTRLVTEDTLPDPIRDRIVQRGGRLAELITCPWCVGVWIAAGWALFTVTAPTVAAPVGAVLAWSSAAGLLASVE